MLFLMKERVRKKEEKMLFITELNDSISKYINIRLSTEETLAQSTMKWYYYLEVIL